MALSDNNDKRQEKREKPMTKVIVRRLPATIEQETFLNQVSPIPEYNYIYMVKGDLSLGENSFSRVYINFLRAEDVFSFKERFDNYVFLDGRGNEYPAVVEFAPFQKIPKKRGKSRVDPKCGSVETDPYYLNFVESLNKPPEQDEQKPEYSLQLNNEDKNDVSTPLLEFIKNKRAQRLKIREMRREERERKRKEFDKRKEYGKSYDDVKYEGKYSEKSPSKGYGSKSHVASKVSSPRHSDKFSERDKKSDDKVETSEKVDKAESRPDRSYEKSYGYKPKEKRFEEKVRKEIKPRFPKKDYSDTREYKPRHDDYKSKDYKEKDYKPKYESRYYDESKKEDAKVFPKKVKKYSERREERKLEAQKAEQKKIQEKTETKETEKVKADQSPTTSKTIETEKEEKFNRPEEKISKSEEKINKSEEKLVNKPSSSSVESKQDSPTLEKESIHYAEKESRRDRENARRIRNKDRPTIAIYRPGMLSKRKQNEDSSEENKKEQNDKE